MNRRTFCSLPILAQPTFRQPTERPNILFLLTDDQRWDTLGAAGNRWIKTPNLDRLAEQGVYFRNNFVTTSICMASRASIFSGLYAAASGIYDSSKPFTPDQIRRTYPELLRQAGYFTGFIGKYGVGRQEPQGLFDFWRGFSGQGRYFPQGEGPGKPHLTSIMESQALDFLSQRPSSKPFCLSVSFKAAHVQDEDPRQFLPSPTSKDLYKDVMFPTPSAESQRQLEALPVEVQRSEGRRRWGIRFSTPELFQQSVRNYYRLLSEVDGAVGRIRTDLRRLNLDQNTIIIFTSDNGFYLGEHGLAGKWLMHEESIRTPMVLFDPRSAARNRNRKVDDMTLNIDLAPTMLQAADVARPLSMQGQSLYRLLEEGNHQWRKDWFYEHHDTSGGWIPRTEGVRTADWKFTKYIDNPEGFEELYHLGSDPRESRNLAKSSGHSATLEKLRRRRNEWKTALASWNAETRWVDPPATW
jgi:arylsulfatase A-like enzyme